MVPLSRWVHGGDGGGGDGGGEGGGGDGGGEGGGGEGGGEGGGGEGGGDGGGAAATHASGQCVQTSSQQSYRARQSESQPQPLGAAPSSQ